MRLPGNHSAEGQNQRYLGSVDLQKNRTFPAGFPLGTVPTLLWRVCLFTPELPGGIPTKETKGIPRSLKTQLVFNKIRNIKRYRKGRRGFWSDLDRFDNSDRSELRGNDGNKACKTRPKRTA